MGGGVVSLGSMEECSKWECSLVEEERSGLRGNKMLLKVRKLDTNMVGLINNCW